MSDKQIPTTSTQVRFLTVDDDYAGQRLDNFLQRELKGLPKSRIYRLLRKGEIRVNKGRTKPDYRVTAGDSVRIPPIRLPDAPASVPLGPGMQGELLSRIIYSDDRLLVVNKPSGLAAHGGSGIKYGLIEAMRKLSPEYERLELVHRLDRETSGCILLARKRSALRELHRQFREHEVNKQYLALVHGSWDAGVTRIEAPLLKTTNNDGERHVRVNAEGRPALTRFRVMQRYPQSTLVEASPVTGRTHQIRVHALHAGHVICGDDRYGERGMNKDDRRNGLKRLFLHAAKLSFNDQDGERIHVEAPLDQALRLYLDKIDN